MDAWGMTSSVGEVDGGGSGGGGSSDAGGGGSGGVGDRTGVGSGAKSSSTSSGTVLEACALFDPRMVEAGVVGTGAIVHPLHPGGFSGIAGMMPRHDVSFADIAEQHHQQQHAPRTPPLQHQQHQQHQRTFEIDSDRRDIFSPFMLSTPPLLDEQGAGGADGRSRGSTASAVAAAVVGDERGVRGDVTGGGDSGGGGGGSSGSDGVYRGEAGEDSGGGVGVGGRSSLLHSVESSPIDAGALSEASPSRRVSGVVADGLGGYTDSGDANLLSGMGGMLDGI